MIDGKGKGVIETVAEEAKGVAVEVYKDVAKPVLSPVGHVAGGFAKLVLWPVKLALDTANAKLDKLAARVEQKLKAVPSERLLAAPATVAGPAALHYALLGDGDEVAELREMFETLLARSMDRETTAIVHPAFVGMLTQLASDEARLLASVKYRVYAAYDVNRPEGDGSIPYGLRTQLGTDLGIDNRRLQGYLMNLDRLGIVRLEDGRDAGTYYGYVALADTLKEEFPGPQEEFPGHTEEPTVDEGAGEAQGGDMLAEAERGFEPFVLSPKALVVTSFGQSFLAACIGDAFLARPVGADE